MSLLKKPAVIIGFDIFLEEHGFGMICKSIGKTHIDIDSMVVEKYRISILEIFNTYNEQFL